MRLAIIIKGLVIAGLASFGSQTYAALPTAPCHSVCSGKLAAGEHCVRVGQYRMYYRVLG